MTVCAVHGCKSCNNSKNKVDGVKFFAFPNDHALHRKWEVACKRTCLPKKPLICSLHFHQNDFKFNPYRIMERAEPKNYRPLKPDAVPTLNLPGSHKNMTSVDESPKARRQRIRAQKKLVRELLQQKTADRNSPPSKKLCQTRNNEIAASTDEVAENSPHLQIPVAEDPPPVAEDMSKSDRFDSNPSPLPLNILTENMFLKNERSFTPLQVPEAQNVHLQGENLFVKYIKQRFELEVLQKKLGMGEEKIDKQENTINKLNKIIKQQKEKITKIHNDRLQMRKNIKLIVKHNAMNIQKRAVVEVERILGKTFTPGQIRKLLTENYFDCKSDDISNAIALQGTSVNCYQRLRKNLPLAKSLEASKKTITTIKIINSLDLKDPNEAVDKKVARPAKKIQLPSKLAIGGKYYKQSEEARPANNIQSLKKTEEDFNVIVLVDWNGQDNIDASIEESSHDDVIYNKGLLGIAGYIAKSMKNEFPQLAKNSSEVLDPKSLPDWLDTVSVGDLVHPSEEFFRDIKIMDGIFSTFHGKGLNLSSACIASVVNMIKNKLPNYDDSVVKLFTRTRLSIRIRHVNNSLCEKAVAVRAWAYKRKFCEN